MAIKGRNGQIRRIQPDRFGDFFDIVYCIIGELRDTMVEKRKKHRQNSHLIIHFPTSEGVSKVSERANE